MGLDSLGQAKTPAGIGQKERDSALRRYEKKKKKKIN